MIKALTPTQKPHSFGLRRKSKGPGLLRRAANYTKAVIRYRRNHGWILPLELSAARHVKCKGNSCGKYDSKLDRCQHSACGCTLKKKVTWSTEKCPLDHWLPVFGPAPAPEKSRA